MRRMNSGLARRLGVELFIVSAIGAALGLIGPFGTFGMPGGARMAYWIIFIIAGYACFRPILWLGDVMSATLSLPAWVGRMLAIALAALPTTLLVAMMFARFDPGIALRNMANGTLYLQVVLIGIIVNGLFALLFPKEKLSPQDTAPPDTAPLPVTGAAPASAAGTGLLPPGFGPVIALKSEDHYVRVHSRERDVLILIRLRDAIATLTDRQGLQVHRSWWVAQDGVARVHRKGREAEIELVTGQRVPVSRDSMPAIRAAGWLTR